jgi:hypothetical protein
MGTLFVLAAACADAERHYTNLGAAGAGGTSAGSAATAGISAIGGSTAGGGMGATAGAPTTGGATTFGGAGGDGGITSTGGATAGVSPTTGGTGVAGGATAGVSPTTGGTGVAGGTSGGSGTAGGSTGGVTAGGGAAVGGSVTTGGAGTVGGATSGGSAPVGGSNTAGGNPTTGGVPAGGSSVGGTSVGGTSAGGAHTGGTLTGGTATGGAPTGGTPTGGAAAGGTATGGALTGGTDTGGRSCAVQVTEKLIDNARGSLTASVGSDPPTPCTPTCSLDVVCGSSITLNAQPDTSTGTGFVGWDISVGTCSGRATPCSFPANADINITGAFSPYNRAFVTSVTSNGNLGGLAGANTVCQKLADSVGLPNAKEYVAFLSTDKVNAIDQLGTTARGWLRTDNRPFADSQANIQKGILWNPLVLTEGAKPAKVGDEVFTGSNGDGTALPRNNCVNWTDGSTVYTQMAGAIGGGSGYWLNFNQSDCTQVSPIYCFGTAYSIPLDPPPPTKGRRIFATTSGFLPTSAGVAAADKLCVDEATKFGICSGSSRCPFMAVLAQTSSNAKARFNYQDTSTPVVRLDNVVVANTSTNLWLSNLTAPISLRSDGSYTAAGDIMFTGATTPSAAGTKAGTCTDWTDPAPLAAAAVVGAPMMGTYWFNVAVRGDCSLASPIYCLEDIP